MSNAVVCEDITKTFGSGETEVRALRGINLEVKEGELMMIVGPSGCGKTTLLSIIAGILNRTSGTCHVFGNDFEKMSEKERSLHRGKEIGFVFQSYNLIPALTAVENTAIPLLLNGSKKGALEKARELLITVGLDGRAEAKPGQLSGGERQRTAICRALIHDPKLIVCDEPTSALDHETGLQVMDLLKEHATGQGRSLIVVTHDSRIFSYADRIAKMDDGRIIDVYNSPEEMQEHE